jgi:hypothetical protein
VSRQPKSREKSRGLKKAEKPQVSRFYFWLFGFFGFF